MDGKVDYEQIIKDIYWLIGSSDPTDADLRGAALQISLVIEQKVPDLGKDVCSKHGWSFPLYGENYLDRLNFYRKKDG